MKRATLIACLLLAANCVFAKRYSHNTRTYTHRSDTYGSGQRGYDGRIHRSRAAKGEFMRQTGYPHGRPGYVVDHIIPLKRGGCDCPENMQWQTIEDAKAKDKWE